MGDAPYKSGGSPELAPQDKEGEDADLKGAPASMDVPEASKAPIPVMEPTIAMAISTSMGKDQGMGAACVLTVTTSMEILNLEAPQWQLATRELQWRNWQKKIWQKAVPECVTHHFPFSWKNCVHNPVHWYLSCSYHLKFVYVLFWLMFTCKLF